MDPTTTYDEMADAVHCEDWDTVEARAKALLHWMNNMGHPPAGMTWPVVVRDINRNLERCCHARGL